MFTFQDHANQVMSHHQTPIALGIGFITVTDDGNGDVMEMDAQYEVLNFDSAGNGSSAKAMTVIAFAVSREGISGTFKPNLGTLRSILQLFKEFQGDGKSHANIDAIRELMGYHSTDNWGQKDERPNEHNLHAVDAELKSSMRRKVPVITVLYSLDEPFGENASVSDAFMRLSLLSERHIVPNSINLDGIFGVLNNVAWTDQGPIAIDRLDDVRRELGRKFKNLTILSVDKFPRMVDYVVPSGVRIADGNRVRLGAHLAEGTTVMHEGFCNFNGGTLGASMVEGRIAASVVVGNGSDIGGGASIMGTLSGGGEEVIRVGANCLLGANSGLGISLGDECIVEAGLYLTAGALVLLPGGSIVKARELSGHSNILFRRHSQRGCIEALPRSGASWEGLNEALHNN